MSSLSTKLIEKGVIPHGNSRAAFILSKQGVANSQEFERIKALPRRLLLVGKDKDGNPAPGKTYTVKLETDQGDVVKEVPDLTKVFAKPGGKLSLWPLQNACLWEGYHANGGFYPIAVGGGKTLISLLMPEAMNSKRAVLLVKPQLRDQLIYKDVPFYLKHFNLPIRNTHIVAYSELSSAKSHDILDKLKPDLIIADEAHSLRLRSSARTRRFLRFMRENPETRFVALSGTMSKRSIFDFAHLMELALKKNSPIPLNFKILEEWAEALDVSDDPKPPGVLLQFCRETENVRQGYRRRMVETAGVVASDEGSIGTSLVIAERKLTMPLAVEAELARLYETWQIGDEELADGMSLSRVARQIACGFYYYWKWPDDKKDVEWVMARRNWHKEVRHYLLNNNRQGMDSPFLLAKAAIEGRWSSEYWEPWSRVKERPEPDVLPRWVSPFMVKDAIIWGRDRLKAKENGIIFYEHKSLGEAIAKIGEFPLYGAGDDASTSDASREPVIVCSIASQGTGKNLQSWSRMLITSPPANGLTFEQLLGRLHRPGQEADEVTIDMYLHCDEFRRAFEKAQKDADYIQGVQGTVQKLNFATKVYQEIKKEAA